MRLKEYIQANLPISDNFLDYSADLFVVATQLDHSRKVIFSKYNYPNVHRDSTTVYNTEVGISDAIAASMSVPPFYSPYPIKHNDTTRYYIDGEIRETLSSHVATDNKCDFIISSWTHSPYHYNREIGSLVHYGLPAICIQTIYLVIQKKIVSSRARRNTAKDIISIINNYLKEEKFSNKNRLKIINVLEQKLDFNPNTNFIDIYPKHQDYKIFFHNSFSLNVGKNLELISLAYQRTKEVFENREWESH